MENYFFPQSDWIIDAIHQKIMPLKGHVSKINYSFENSITLNKEGV
jgi:2-oxoisovalerate dehydrogenase E1 component